MRHPPRRVHILVEAAPSHNLRPSVSIETVASGAIIYGVRVAARSLRTARRVAEQEYAELRKFAGKMRESERGEKAT